VPCTCLEISRCVAPITITNPSNANQINPNKSDKFDNEEYFDGA